MSENSYYIETMTLELAKRILDEGKASNIESALDMIYESNVYEKLIDERTRLMYQSPGFVYALLMEEKQGA